MLGGGGGKTNPTQQKNLNVFPLFVHSWPGGQRHGKDPISCGMEKQAMASNNNIIFFTFNRSIQVTKHFTQDGIMTKYMPNMMHMLKQKLGHINKSHPVCLNRLSYVKR